MGDEVLNLRCFWVYVSGVFVLFVVVIVVVGESELGVLGDCWVGLN